MSAQLKNCSKGDISFIKTISSQFSFNEVGFKHLRSIDTIVKQMQIWNELWCSELLLIQRTIPIPDPIKNFSVNLRYAGIRPLWLVEKGHVTFISPK